MNQHQITVTRGDDRTLTFSFDADYTDATARLTADSLFTRTGTVDATPFEAGVGEEPDTPASTVVTVALAAEDTEDVRDLRRAYRYELELTLDGGDVRTVRRGLFVVVPDLEAV